MADMNSNLPAWFQLMNQPKNPYSIDDNQSLDPNAMMSGSQQNSGGIQNNFSDLLSSLGIQSSQPKDPLINALMTPVAIKSSPRTSAPARAPASMATAQQIYDSQMARQATNEPMNDEKSSLSDFKDLLDKYKTRPRDIDFSAILPLVSAVSGMDLTKNYRAPESEQEKQMNVLGLQDKLDKGYGEYANRSNQFLKSQDDAKIQSDYLRNQSALAKAVASQENGANKTNTLEADKTRQLLETTRGAADAKQALLDLLNISKAKGLINMYKDPNNLSQDQVDLLAMELGKVASGGVPSQHELESISPGALRGRLGKSFGQLTNQRTPANAASFVKDYNLYLDELKGVAQDLTVNRAKRVLDAAEGLTPKTRSNLTNIYVNRFQRELDAAGQGRQFSGDDDSAGAPMGGPPVGTKHPDAQGVMRTFKGGDFRDKNNWVAE